MNNFKVEIYNPETKIWEDKSKNAVFPLKYARLLDERLDEAEIELRHLDVDFYNPLIKVRLTLTNTPEQVFSESYFEKVKARSQNPLIDITYNSATGKITETYVINMLIANDNSTKVMVDNRYNHKIYLIELTKLLEGFVGDSITFTNTLR